MLRTLTLAFACLVAASASLVQNAQQKTPAAEPAHEHTSSTQSAGGRISGQVILSDTRKPGRGVGVNISREATPGQHDAFRSFAMTDGEGRYQFDHLKPGDYFITIRTNGYLYLPPPGTTQSSNPNVAQPETYIAANKITLHTNESTMFDVTLQPSASLSGYVYFDDGSPAMNAEIRVEQTDPGPFYKPKPGEPSYMPVLRIGDRGKTDDRGHFRITSLGTGTYRVAAAPALQAPFSDYIFMPNLSVELNNELHQPSFLTVFSGDTIHRAQAKTYKLKPGDEVSDIRITIPLSSLYKIRGYVEVNDGRTPNEGLATLIDITDPQIHFQTGLNKDGSFLFAAIPDGTYKLTVSQSFIAKPDTSAKEYNDDDLDIAINAFSNVESTIIVKDSDILDLHFEVHEIPIPPDPPDEP